MFGNPVCNPPHSNFFFLLNQDWPHFRRSKQNLDPSWQSIHRLSTIATLQKLFRSVLLHQFRCLTTFAAMSFPSQGSEMGGQERPVAQRWSPARTIFL